MEHLKLTFGDIMQSNILYYDKVIEVSCYSICDFLKINNLPSIDGKNYYQISEGRFEKRKILQQNILSRNTPIFNKELIKKFRDNSHDVFFVFEEDYLCGVVHFSDYNRDIVLQSIQDDILTFERKLRQWIILNGFTNNDMRKFFEYKRNKARGNSLSFYESKIKSYEYRQEEINALGPFQSFEFSDLLEFVSSGFTNRIYEMGKANILNEVKQVSNIIREMRNMAMHGKNPISKDSSTSIYSLESLVYLLESLDVFRMHYALITNKVRNHPDFLRSVELENRSKLEIIHNHHPKALEYFLGF